MNKDQETVLITMVEDLEAGKNPNVEQLNVLPKLKVTNAADLHEQPIKPREWLIEGWLPKGCVTSLYGDGGVGKSLLALQVGTAIATGNQIFGLETEKSKVLAIFCEDDGDEVHRRQNSICECDGLEFLDLKDLNWISRCGEEENLLAVKNHDGSISRTPLFNAIRAKAKGMGVSLIILDNIAHLYPGDENNRTEVTAFVNILNDLALAIDGAVLLLGHTPKSDAEFSGSTGWNNAVRSRWFFSRPKIEGRPDDDQDDTMIDHRVLKKGKSNYGRMGDEIGLVWDQGAFKPAFQGSTMSSNSMEAKMREREIEVAFLKELDARNGQIRPVSASPQSPKNYAPKVFMRADRFKDLKARTNEIEAGMERLFKQEKIIGHGPVGKSFERREMKYGIIRSEN